MVFIAHSPDFTLPLSYPPTHPSIHPLLPHPCTAHPLSLPRSHTTITTTTLLTTTTITTLTPTPLSPLPLPPLTPLSQPLTVSILSERRAFQPFGMCGGGPGARGLNILTLAGQGRQISLGGKNTVKVVRGDRLSIFTPGGGGYGAPGSAGSTGVSGSDGSGSGSRRGDGESAPESGSRPQDGSVTAAAGSGASIPYRTSGSLMQYTLDQESV